MPDSARMHECAYDVLMECAERLQKHQESGKTLKTIAEVAEDLSVTDEELEAVGDVKIEDE